MHWADVLAGELLERGNEHVLATGITPSGPIHVGNLREVLTTEAVHRAVRDAGGRSRLLYIGDTYDPLRKVYPFLVEHPTINYDEHVGRPLSEVPDPEGCHGSYAQHFLEPFLAALDELGVEPEVKLAHELYAEGAYKDAIQRALDQTPRIKQVLEEVSGRELPPDWLPLNIRCEVCDRVMGTKPVLYEFPEVEYACGCGHEGVRDVRDASVGKLPWRVDWPARWSFLDVSFEAFGKDHAAAGGSWDTAQPIVRDVFGREPPHHAVYEFIHVKGAGAMHSSAGTGIAAEDVLRVTPPEVLRFFFMRYQPNKHVEFDPGDGLLDLVDEHDRAFAAHLDTGESAEIKDLERVLTLSQPSGELPDDPGALVGMRHLADVVQVYPGLEQVLASLERTRHIDRASLDEHDLALLEGRIEHCRAWLDAFAPDDVRFEIPDDVPEAAKDHDGIGVLATLADVVAELDWDPEELHNAVYTTAEKEGVKGGAVFRAAYLAILGKPRGPRLGAFLASLERDWVVERLRQAAAANET